MASVHHGSLEVLHPQIRPPSAARQPPAGTAISQMSALLLSPFLPSTLFRPRTIRENYSRGSHQDSTLETCMEPEGGPEEIPKKMQKQLNTVSFPVGTRVLLL